VRKKNLGGTVWNGKVKNRESDKKGKRKRMGPGRGPLPISIERQGEGGLYIVCRPGVKKHKTGRDTPEL